VQRPSVPSISSKEEAVKPFIALAALLSTGCALAPGGLPPQPTPVWIRSHNQSPVDVYLLCGDRDARWLGAIMEKGSDAFEIPVDQPYCGRGLNFFLVVQKQQRGYWVGPFWPRRGEVVDLVIEKYAGLSNGRVRFDAQ
jgi:hypothetical protein